MIHEGTFMYVKKWKMTALAVFISAVIVILLITCIRSADHPRDQGFFIALSVLVIPFFGIKYLLSRGSREDRGWCMSLPEMVMQFCPVRDCSREFS